MQNKRTKWKNQYEQIESASKFHESVRKIFCTDHFFKSLKCFQEVPVKALVPTYNPNHYVDWFVDELGIVVELHGAHHYKLTNFGNVPHHKAVSDFNHIKYRDNLKKTALLDAGFDYREISYRYYNKLTPELLKNILIYGVYNV